MDVLGAREQPSRCLSFTAVKWESVEPQGNCERKGLPQFWAGEGRLLKKVQGLVLGSSKSHRKPGPERARPCVQVLAL